MVILITKKKEEVLNEGAAHKSPFVGGGGASRIAVRFSYWAEEWYKSETVHYFYVCLITISAQWGE
jgi:hypothetical protein